MVNYITLIALDCVENVNSSPFCGSLRSFWYSSLNEFFFAYNLPQFISREDRREFLACVKHQREDHGVARRANMLLLLGDGKSCVAIASVFYLDDDTVRSWHKQYLTMGWIPWFMRAGKADTRGCLSRRRSLLALGLKKRKIAKTADEINSIEAI